MLAFLFSFLFIFQAQDSVITETQLNAAALSQTADTTAGRYLYVDNIFIIGNKQTKKAIILREMSIIQGEYYYEDDLKELIKSDKHKIINTRLFNTAEVSMLELSDSRIDIVIKVTERWYTFPVPIFDLVDRNFNDWWQNQDHDLSRVNYGLKLYRNNMRGRNETLRLQFQMGYTKQFGIAYKIPYLDRSKRHGMYIEYLYAENKNIALETVDHKRVFFDSEELLRLQRLYRVGYQFRNSFYTTHFFSLAYNDNEINDTIADINPAYYLKGQTVQQFVTLSYDMNFDKRDIHSYPLHGHRTTFFANKRGVGLFNDVDQFDIGLNHARYLDLQRNFYLSNYTSLYVSGPDKQSYANLNGLGYKKDFIRGYELYVVEGQRFYLNRTTFKKKLFSSNTRLGFIPFEQFQNFPLAVYLKTYFDMGYVENLENYNDNLRLTDRYLFGTGLGIDFVSYYDTVIRFEYSINREKETGLFIHFKKEF